MSDEQLRQSLTALRAELDRLEAKEAEVRERLDTLITSVETHVDAPGDTAHHAPLFGISANPFWTSKCRIPGPPPFSTRSRRH